jgi:uncharacterized protein (TIGR02145 family)
MRIKHTFNLIILVVISASAINLMSCKKSEDTSIKPTAVSVLATYIGQQWAVLNGIVNPNNKTVTVTFEYDTITAYAHSVNATPVIISGKTNTTVTASLTGLIPGVTYHYRLKVVSPTETVTGVDISFTTTNPNKSTILFNPGLSYGSVTDIDNNFYKTIAIGSQTWMAENLKTTRYNDGTGLEYVPIDKIWADSVLAGYCWYNNDSVVYGAIYNWTAISSGNLCPSGWHVPTDDDWSTLITTIGGDSLAATKLMESGNGHWQTPNTSLINESGFTALPGGYRNYSGAFGNIKRYGYWWSSTESSSVNAYCRVIYYGFKYMTRTNGSKKSGISIRCVKD